MEKALLFGASSLGEKAFHTIKNDCDIVGFIDNSEKKIGQTFLGKNIYSPKEAIKMGIKIIISSSYHKEISEQLKKLRFNDYRVIAILNSKYYKYVLLDTLNKKDEYHISKYICENIKYLSLDNVIKGIENKNNIIFLLKYFLKINRVSENQYLDCLKQFIFKFTKNDNKEIINISSLMYCPQILLLLTIDCFNNKFKDDCKLLRYILYKMIKDNMYEEINIIKDFIIKYISEESIAFEEKMYFHTVLVFLRHENSLENIIKEMVVDKENTKSHYSMFYNIMAYSFKYNISLSQNSLKMMREKLTELAIPFINKNSVKTSNYKKDAVFVVVDILLDLDHSPTKLIFDYAFELSKIYKDKKIIIIVEQNNLFSKYCNEVLFLFDGYSAYGLPGSWLERVHGDYIKDYNNIEIFYSNLNLPKNDRTNEILGLLQKYTPMFVFTNSRISLVNRVLYEHFPVMYLATMSKFEYINEADIYIYPSNCFFNKTIEESIKSKILAVEHTFKLDFTNPKGLYKRKDFGFNEDEFIMITVGNRLNYEITEEYIDTICSFLEDNKKARWLIVGSFDFNYLKMKYEDIFTNSISYIQYEQQLIELYNICDIYLNPKRLGGGISVAMAIYAGLPIVAYSDKSDSLHFVGKENSFGTDIQYLQEVRKLFDSIEYRNMRRQILKHRLNSMFNSNLKDITRDIIKIANINYSKRIQKNI